LHPTHSVTRLATDASARGLFHAFTVRSAPLVRVPSTAVRGHLTAETVKRTCTSAVADSDVVASMAQPVFEPCFRNM